VIHPAPVTDGRKRPRSPKLPASMPVCTNPWLVCSPPTKAHSPVRERAIPQGTTAGSGGSHLVAKSGRNHFCPEFDPLYERNEAGPRGRYIREFPHRDKEHHNKASVVRPDTPLTPGATGPEACPATPVTPGTPRVFIVLLTSYPQCHDLSQTCRPSIPKWLPL